MSNSIFIPLILVPFDIYELGFVLNPAFSEFNLPSPKIWLDSKESLSTSLTDGFVMIEGAEDYNQCWLSINRCAAELTGDEECSILANVKTRGNWIFAGVVAYALCKIWGRTVFNDAGELDGQESYSAESLKEVIRNLT